jgi:hypothetical protein
MDGRLELVYWDDVLSSQSREPSAPQPMGVVA